VRLTLRPATVAAIRAGAFVARCTGSAMLAYLAAVQIGLGHPVWAVVSALIVSQETAQDTRRSFLWRIVGTMIGAGVAILSAWAFLSDPARPLAAIAIAVLVSAGIARRWPLLRVTMWTSALVILTADVDHTIVHTAIQRAGEVVLGGSIGAAIHVLLEIVVTRLLQGYRPAEGNAPAWRFEGR